MTWVKGRESAAMKGRRYLIEGRLTVERVERDLVIASCKGDSGEVYRLGYDPEARQWRCTCPALRRCSHLVGLQLITVRVPERQNGFKPRGHEDEAWWR
jgi:uncharacterized Zn finger protein